MPFLTKIKSDFLSKNLANLGFLYFLFSVIDLNEIFQFHDKKYEFSFWLLWQQP